MCHINFSTLSRHEMTSAPSSPSSSQDGLLTAIDREISEIRESGRESGLSAWVAFASFASLSWLLFDQLGKEGFHVLTAVIVYYYCSVLAMSLAISLYILEPPRRQLAPANRYMLTSRLYGKGRVPFIIIFLWCAIGTTLAIVLRNQLPLAHRLVPVIGWGLLGLGILLMVVMSFKERLMRNPSSQQGSAEGRIAFALLAVLYLLIAIDAVWRHRTSIVDGIGPSLRAGILASSLPAILVSCFPSLQSATTESLHELRRELLLGRLSEAQVRTQFDTILLGLRISDLFAADIATVLRLQRDSYEAQKQMADAVEILSPLWNRDRERLSEEELRSAKAAVGNIVDAKNRLEATSNEFKVAAMEMAKRIVQASLVGGNPDADFEEFKQTFSELNSSLADATSEVQSRLMKAATVFGIDLKQLEPENTPPRSAVTTAFLGILGS
jgi:hypothetical protein